jgi:hypothetical protein
VSLEMKKVPAFRSNTITAASPSISLLPKNFWGALSVGNKTIILSEDFKSFVFEENFEKNMTLKKQKIYI